MDMPTSLTELEKRLLNEFQRDFPLCSRPYMAIAEKLGSDEATVIRTLEDLTARGYIARIGGTFRPQRAGWSTLAALAVPAARMNAVAAYVSALPEVNHNYERTHRYNMWFVVTGENRAHVDRVVAEIAAHTDLPILNLPMEESFHLDLGFELSWS